VYRKQRANAVEDVMKLSWLEKSKPVTKQSPRIKSDESYYLAAQAPHLALHAPHFCMVLLAPHLLPPQARHIMEQPPRAAVVTTAIARALARVDDMEFMVMLLKVMKLRTAYCLTAAQPPLLAPHLALQAPHLAFIFLA
jgi:hypothetical protein